MNIRFYNGKVCTMAGNDAKITGDEVWIQDDQIRYVGPSKPHSGFDREIDLAGNLLLPGFKNAHTHSAMTFLRSYADDLPLLDWLEKQVFPMEAKLTPEDIGPLCKLAIMEYLTSGITSNFDMYMFNEENAKASVECGFRTALCSGINKFGGTVERLEEEYLHFNKYHPLISYQLGFHAEYTCERDMLEGIAALGRKHKAPIYCHNSEGRPEVEGCLERYGKTPTAFLDSLGMYEYGGGGFHCVHFTDEDMEIFRKRGAWVISNPGSNAKLASGIAPLTKMRKAGLGIALGTDGAASNNCLDFFREMFLATALQKLREDDAAVMDALEVLRMSTVNGARAMGLTDCDCIAPGKQADLVVLDLNQPNMQPLNTPLKNVVYSGSKQNVKLTMVAGKALYEDGVFHIGVEPEWVYRKANEIIRRMR